MAFLYFSRTVTEKIPMMLQGKRKIHTSIYHYYYRDLLLSEDSIKSISRKLSLS